MRKPRKFKYRGKYLTAEQIAASEGVTRHAIYERLRCRKPLEKKAKAPRVVGKGLPDIRKRYRYMGVLKTAHEIAVIEGVTPQAVMSIYRGNTPVRSKRFAIHRDLRDGTLTLQADDATLEMLRALFTPPI